MIWKFGNEYGQYSLDILSKVSGPIIKLPLIVAKSSIEYYSPCPASNHKLEDEAGITVLLTCSRIL